MTCQPILPKTLSGEGTSNHPGSAGSEAKAPVTPNLQKPLLPGAPCLLGPTPTGRGDSDTLLVLGAQAWLEEKSRQETPTCRAVGTHSADREEDLRVTMKHLQRGPAVPLGEAGVPIQ